VQQPLVQSEACAQGIRHTGWSVAFSVHVSPSQHALSRQLDSSAAQSPARAAGLEQPRTVLPASPVQKQDACSKLMQVKAAQYGVSAVRPGSAVAPSANFGMQTLPSS
jgi:hypothetical protein